MVVLSCALLLVFSRLKCLILVTQSPKYSRLKRITNQIWFVYTAHCCQIPIYTKRRLVMQILVHQTNIFIKYHCNVDYLSRVQLIGQKVKFDYCLSNYSLCSFGALFLCWDKHNNKTHSTILYIITIFHLFRQILLFFLLLGLKFLPWTWCIFIWKVFLFFPYRLPGWFEFVPAANGLKTLGHPRQEEGKKSSQDWCNIVCTDKMFAGGK